MGHELVAYAAVDLSTVLWIKVVVANDSKQNTSPSLEFSIVALSMSKSDMSAAFSCQSRIAGFKSIKADGVSGA
jgi:hypothetical protein